ncbi:MAG: hypothetical protein ACC707_12600 [Thiohalomonadales bacterium]
MIAKKTTGLALAIAAAGLFTLAPVNMTMADSVAKVHCYGVNKCKGQNDCKTVNNSCKGQSACKGKGFVAISQEACDKVGGKKGA